jgi:hypothetical protein
VSIDVEWSKDHMSAIGAYTLLFISNIMVGKNGDWAGPLGRSVEHSNGKDGESAVAVLRFLCDSPRLCRLRTEGLVPMSKY